MASSPSRLIGWLSKNIKARVSDALSFSDGSAAKDDEAVDESLPVRERVIRYSESSAVAHRMYVVREVVDLAREAGVEMAVSFLVPVIEKLVRDPDASIRSQLVESLPAFCKFLMDNLDQEGYTTNVLHILLPLVAEFTTDDNPQTRAAAVTALVVLARSIRHQDLVPYLIPIIRSLAKDRTEEEHRVQAAILFHALAATLGREVCLDHVVSRVELLGKDPQFRVRKAVAQHLGMLVSVACAKKKKKDSISQSSGEGAVVIVVPEDGGDESQEDVAREKEAAASQTLLNLYEGLSKDEIWGVRKACCDSLVAISAAYPSEVRSSVLVPIFERLADDESRWVRGAVFQCLGPFIATFSDGRVDPKLLMFYRTMPHPSKHGRDGDIALYCAHAFPGVLYTIGGQRWGELSDLYLLLVKDLQWKVRETLAHSLHEVAKLVGQSIAERTLLTIFEAFMQDLEEVQLGVVTHLGDFLAVLGLECRSQYAHTVHELQEATNWRLRELTARQMDQFGRLFGEEELVKTILPACFALCRDRVLTVRNAAVISTGKLLAGLEADDSKLFEMVRENVWAMREGSFHDRQTMVLICGQYLAEGGQKKQVFAELVESLVTDRVPNVRMKVASVLRLHVPDSPHLEVLKTDPDYDVRFGATNVFVPFTERSKKAKLVHDTTANLLRQVEQEGSVGAAALATPERNRLRDSQAEFVDSSNLITQMQKGGDDSADDPELLATAKQ